MPAVADAPRAQQDRAAMRAEVKALAGMIGLRAAARECGINEDTVKKWAQRFHWRVSRMPPVVVKSNGGNGHAPAAPTIAPQDAMAHIMARHADRTRIAMASSSTKVFEHLADSPPAALIQPGTGLAASKWAGVAGMAHGWNTEQGTKVAVQINFADDNAKAQELWQALRQREAQRAATAPQAPAQLPPTA